MSIKPLFFTILLFVSSTTVAAPSPYNQWWKAATDFYAKKEFDSAAFYFEKIAAQKPATAALYYNLGNTYYRMNQVAPAVLNYERALKLDPGNKKIQDNLTLTQSRINNRIQPAQDIFFVQWWNSLVSGSKAEMWALLSMLFFVTLISILAAKRMGKLSNLPPQITGVLAVCWIIVMILGFLSAGNKYNSTRAVVMQNDSPLNEKAGGNGKPKALVPEGTTVKLLETQNGHVQVRLPDGREGWIQETMLAKI